MNQQLSMDEARQLREMTKVIKKAGEIWPSSFVARKSISDFTGGIYTRVTMARYDQAKKGPEGAFRLGRGVVYPVDKLCAWLIARASPGLPSA